ncbi:MAG: glycosyltransferase 87 family protein [Candidatus Sumerlaeia bacterium]|nr:glycosyltransferase 87 family protein [Candidatus Sumerlaeia bacterium]
MPASDADPSATERAAVVVLTVFRASRADRRHLVQAAEQADFILLLPPEDWSSHTAVAPRFAEAGRSAGLEAADVLRPAIWHLAEIPAGVRGGAMLLRAPTAAAPTGLADFGAAHLVHPDEPHAAGDPPADPLRWVSRAAGRLAGAVRAERELLSRGCREAPPSPLRALSRGTVARSTAPLWIAMAGASAEAVSKHARGRPEWSHYRDFVHDPLAVATGPDKDLFGYLPGAKALLTPFVESEPFGFALFLALNLCAVAGIFLIGARCLLPATEDRALCAHRLWWLSVCLAVPAYFTVQNNQLVAFTVFLSMLSFALLARGIQFTAGGLLAGAILVKTLPLALVGLGVLRGRWWFAATAVSLALASTFLLGALTDGWASTLYHHLAWGRMVALQHPLETFASGRPLSMSDNQSPLAYMVELSVWLDSPGVAAAAALAMQVSGVALLAATALLAGRREAHWKLFAVWLAWLAWATPFGRYYYALFWVPLWYMMAGRGAINLRSPAVLWYALPLGTLLARGGNPTYAVVATVTAGLAARWLWADVIDAARALAESGSRFRDRRIRRRARTVALAVAALAVAAAGTVVYGEYREAFDFRSLVAQYRRERTPGDSLVVLMDGRSNAAADEPGARQVPEARLDELDPFFEDGDRDFVLLEYDELAAVERFYGRRRFDRVAANRSYVLLREDQPTVP